MIVKRYAAIDIGSNAVRLLINTVAEAESTAPVFKKAALVRVPIRLGADVFTEGKISDQNFERMLQTMEAFKLLMQAHNIDCYKACGTSAMRDAKNGKALTDFIKERSGISIEIIDGQHEAAFIAATDLRELIKSDRTYLYVDVGGGSTEFTVFSKGKSIASKSFKLGTVRLLNGMVNPKLWQEAEAWITQHTHKFKTVRMIGTGGNINHIFKHSGREKGHPLTYAYLADYYKMIQQLTYEERVTQLEMKLDRADVIVPATKIYLSAMKWSKARKIYVPKIGLADGIIKTLYNENQLN